MTTTFQKRRRVLFLATLAVCAGAATISACNDDSSIEGLESGGGITIALAPAELTVQAGTSGDVQVTVGRTGAFTGAVALKSGGEPDGVAVSLSPGVVDAGETSATATISVDAATTPGTYLVTVAGTASLISTGQARVTLIVTPGAPPEAARR